MKSEQYIKAVLYVAVFGWAGVLLVSGQKLTSAELKPFSTVTSIVVFVSVAFDLWLWKIPLLHDWLVKRPVISGTWKVEIRSNWKDPVTGAGIQPAEGFMVVRQTFSTLSLRILTAESISELVGTEIVCSADGLYCVSGVYRNEPQYEVRGRSPIHYGAVWLKIVDEPTGKRMLGHYWTDRGTAGALDLSKQQSTKFQTFHSAQAYYARLP